MLFIDRLQASDASFVLTNANCAVISSICRRLDGLPLALELAAARCAHVSPVDLLPLLAHRLPLLTLSSQDAPVRLQTMRNAIEWSVDLLDDQARTLFLQLAVLPDSFPLDCVAAVATSSERSDVANDGIIALGTLIDLHLSRRSIKMRFVPLPDAGNRS